MQIDHTEWTFNDYFAFLLVYAAESDFVVREKERDIIIQKIGEERFNKMLSHFKDLKDVERIDLVYAFKGKYCFNPDETDSVLAEVKEVLKADGHYGAVEEEIFISIRKILKFKDPNCETDVA